MSRSDGNCKPHLPVQGFLRLPEGTRTAHPWTLATLAREAGMSRSSFAERFARAIGTTPLNYLLQWRLAVAKDLLAREQKSVGETALAVGYESASGFSTAFSRRGKR